MWDDIGRRGTCWEPAGSCWCPGECWRYLESALAEVMLEPVPVRRLVVCGTRYCRPEVVTGVRVGLCRYKLATLALLLYRFDGFVIVALERRLTCLDCCSHIWRVPFAFEREHVNGGEEKRPCSARGSGGS